ncbi:MAG: squalene/phytoene synthase family protein [Alphaproteobacteria bacterium]|nr:squalene/phytoene synthase family protein [Alphaproteobacteria bacterium]
MQAIGNHIYQCAASVRRDDHDRYLTVLHARTKDRPALFALFAFNIEIAKTREVVSEPALGEIRLQWWRETVEQLYAGHCREHDVVRALQEVMLERQLPKSALIDLIDAREADLYDEQPKSLAALETYAERTGGGIQALAALSLGASNGALEAARHVGIAWALTGLVRALPYHLRQGRVYVPSDLMVEEGLVDPLRPDAEQSEALSRILRRIGDRARVHLVCARGKAGGVSSVVKPVLRLACLADGYLACLERSGYVPDCVNYERGALGRQFRLTWAGLTRNY